MVLLNGQRHDFLKDDIVVVNSNVIHYTCTESRLTYSCLIISTEFCRQMGIDYDLLSFSPLIRDPRMTELFSQLIRVHAERDAPLRIAQLNKLLLEILISLGTRHVVRETVVPKSKSFDAVKNTLSYIRRNYHLKLTLEKISTEVMFDRYALCREFKKITGQTIFENLNQYRCLAASEHIKNGYSVSEAATMCGFENLSFFTKTFKKYIGVLPSACKPNLTHISARQSDEALPLR